MSSSSGFELNKIAGAVLLAGLIAMVVGTVADVLYKPHVDPDKRGYKVEVAEEPAAGGAAAKEEVIDIPALMAAANPEKGAAVIKKCATCHDFSKGGPNKIGPELWGVVGRPKAHNPGFTYSEAITKHGGNWDYESLFAFLKAPAKYAPGTKMSFAGIKKPSDIADLVAHLRTLSDTQYPLPTPSAAPAAEAAPAAAPAQ